VSKVHCGSAFEPGASGLPYYCTLHVCVTDVIGALTVQWQKRKEGWEQEEEDGWVTNYCTPPVTVSDVIGGLAV